MKRILSLVMIAWAEIALAADDEDLILTPRDKAVAELAGKRTEEKLLRAELAEKTKQLERGEELAKEAKEDGEDSEDDLSWRSAINFALQNQTLGINDRLKALEPEIKQARDALSALDLKTAKKSSRKDLPKGEDGKSDLVQGARDAVDTATERPSPQQLGPDGKPCPDPPRGMSIPIQPVNSRGARDIER